jgi:hypothetical protein
MLGSDGQPIVLSAIGDPKALGIYLTRSGFACLTPVGSVVDLSNFYEMLMPVCSRHGAMHIPPA